MSALKSRSNSLAGLTLDAILGGENAVPTPEQSPPLTQQQSLVTQPNSQTLLDIISDEFPKEEHHKERATWKIFRDKLRLKRTGSAWTSSLHIPTSDIFISDSKRGTFGFASINDTLNIRNLISAIPMSDPPGRAMFTRGSSMRVGSTKNPDDSIDVNIPGDGPPSRSFKPQLSRHDSVRDHGDGEDDSRRRNAVVTFVEERTLSARQAVAAQEAAEAEAAAAAGSDDDDDDDDEDDDESGEEEEESEDAPKPVTMSLMDLLQETDRQMGLSGSRYAMDDDEDEYDEEDENYEEEGGGDGDGGGELSCCACMVKIKGTATTLCGHAFCKLCSKELAVQKGHCPVCSSFVLEFLEIF